MYRHIKQQNPLCCGAACMQMIYEYFGISIINQSEIWKQIQRPSIYSSMECDPNKMQRHFHSHKFSCMYVLAFPNGDVKAFLADISRRKIPAIINYTVSMNEHHFVVLEKVQSNGIEVQNPFISLPNSFLPYDQLREPLIMLIDKSTGSIKCRHCGAIFPCNDFFQKLYGLPISRCAYCQEVI